jgi:hypothetical protein
MARPLRLEFAGVSGAGYQSTYSAIAISTEIAS